MGRMWWFNILGDNRRSISGLLQIYLITEGCVLRTGKLVSLKRENTELILTVKITGWRQIIDYFGLSIESDPSSVVKKNVYLVHIGFIPRPSSVKIHAETHHLDK